jgi:ribosomal protein L16/L10AE
MGKGKGTKISDWICPLKAGKVIYEISPKRRKIKFKRLNFYKLTMLRALKLAQTKFAFPTIIRNLLD